MATFSKNGALLVSAALFCVAVGTVAYLQYTGRIELPYLPIKKPAMENEYAEKFNSALSLHVEKNYDGAISELEALVKNTNDPVKVATVKEKLGINYLGKGFAVSEINDTVKKGMDTLWSIAIDPTLPPQLRAAALNDLGTTFGLHENDFYLTYATLPPFNTYISARTEPRGSLKAALKIFEYADSLSKNSYSKLSMVRMYVVLIADQTLPAGMDDKAAAEEIQELVKSSDNLADISTYPGATQARLSLERAKGLALSSTILGTSSRQERGIILKEALTKAQEAASSGDKYAKDVEMEARFWYASFLAAGGQTQVAEIEEVVAPFKPGATPASDFFITREMLITVGAQPDTMYAKRRGLEIAKLSPTFKEFAISIGWKF